jgi:hypothetical protein
MSLTTLKDDLLAEFREERILINDQIELLDPLATSLRMPAAQRLLSSSTLILSEYICYIISVGGIAFIALMHKIYPFSLLSTIFYSPAQRNFIGGPNLFYLTLGVYSLASIAVILTFIIGRVAREMRLKNEILYVAGKDIKTIVGQHLHRKAALDTIEQRHMLGLSGIGHHSERQRMASPTAATTPFYASPVGAINEIRNPGFD